MTTRGVGRRPSRVRGHGGQATVEVALVLPIVVALFLLVVQVALMARDEVLVIHAAHEAARAAAIDDRPQAPLEAARRSGPLDPARLQVRVSPRGQPGSLVVVDVSYRTPTEVPLVGSLAGDVVLHAQAAMRVEG